MQSLSAPGTFSDIAYDHDGRLYVARPTSGWVFLDEIVGDQLVTRAQLRCEGGGNAFVRLRAVESGLWAFHRPQDGRSVILTNVSAPCATCNGNGCEACLGSGRATRVFTGIFHTWPVALGAHGYVLNDAETGWRSQSYQHAPLASGPWVPGDGIARLGDDNHPVSNADNYPKESAAWGILNPQYAGRVIGGEGATGGIPLVLDGVTKQVIENFQPIHFMPRVAEHPNGREWAAISTDYATARMYHGIDAAWFGALVDPPVDPPSTEYLPMTVTALSGPLKSGKNKGKIRITVLTEVGATQPTLGQVLEVKKY